MKWKQLNWIQYWTYAPFSPISMKNWMQFILLMPKHTYIYHIYYIFNFKLTITKTCIRCFKNVRSWLYLGLLYKVTRQSRYSVSLKFSFSLMYELSLHFEIFLKQDFSPQSSMFKWHVYLVHRKGNQVENYVYSHGLVPCMVHVSFTFRMKSIFVIFLPRRSVCRKIYTLRLISSAEMCTCHLGNL